MDRDNSGDLKEKANREGFIEDEAYQCFKNAVEFALGQFTAQRNIDKETLRVSLSGGAKEPVKEEKAPMPDLSNPNHVMTPEEIAALLANM